MEPDSHRSSHDLAKVGALVLAAGFSHRFGSIKLLAPLAGSTVIQTTLHEIHRALDHSLLVTRPQLESDLAPFAKDITVFDEAHRGMGETLAHGISLVSDWDAAIICLADMPFISEDVYRRIASHCQRDRIVLPRHQGKPANPVGFGADFFGELAELTGDTGGKSVLQRHPEAVLALDIDDVSVIEDIDTPEDLARYLAEHRTA